jgi:hypothetical protein
MAVIGSFALAGFFFWLGGPVAALGLWLLGLVGLLASPLWHAVEKVVGGVAFVAGPAAVLGLWVGYVAHWGWFRNVVDPRPPRLAELATTGLVIAGLVVVSAWLLSRGSARARDRASARATDRRR